MCEVNKFLDSSPYKLRDQEGYYCTKRTRQSIYCLIQRVLALSITEYFYYYLQGQILFHVEDNILHIINLNGKQQIKQILCLLIRYMMEKYHQVSNYKHIYMKTELLLIAFLFLLYFLVKSTVLNTTILWGRLYLHTMCQEKKIFTIQL